MMLYLHIPFCAKKCRYCAFYSVTDASFQAAYIDRLCDMLAQTEGTFESIYIGGGTPSVLDRSLFQKLLDALAGRTAGEFTVEVNPDSTDAALLQQLAAGGVNRLSVGVQSLWDDELRAAGRLHTAAQALRALTLARQAGFENISADLIYGLPGQTPERFLHSLKQLTDAEIPHLSCYNLTLEAGTPFGEHPPQLPDEAAQLEMYRLLCAHLRAAGYEHYEISNFALPGRRAEHNSGYWSGREYLGLGSGAHSLIGGKRCAFSEDIVHFINKRGMEFDEEIVLDAADRREERIMLGLRTDSGTELGLLDEKKARRYQAMGLADIRDGRLILNERGFLVSNTVIADLL